jgi:hypothetical protein
LPARDVAGTRAKTYTRAMPVPLLLTLLAATSTPAFAGFHFVHQDWEIACDNTGTCRAAGYQPGDGDLALSVLFTRAAGPGADVEGELTLGDMEGTHSASLVLEIDGRRIGAPLKGPNNYALAPEHVAALLAALRRDSVIEFVGDERWLLSDDGASAVLLKMDEFQGRLGTTGALVRRGARDESSVPAPVPAPKLKRVRLPGPDADDARLSADPTFVAAVRAAAKRDECDDPEDLFDDAIEVWRVDARRRLVATPCWQGAYNFGSGYWLIDAAPPHAATLVTRSGSDYESGRITAQHKGRGLGDCWSADEWTWDGQAFVHTRQATTGLCKYVVLGGTWDLPTIVTTVDESP